MAFNRLFGAGSEAGDVGAVFVDDQGGHDDREDEQGELLVGDRPAENDCGDDVGNGEADGSEHGGEADVAPGEEDDEEDSEGDEGGEGVVGPEAEDQAGGGGDAFAAFEADVDGEHVAEDGGEADQEPGEEVFGVELVGGEVSAAEDGVSGEHGEEGFE